MTPSNAEALIIFLFYGLAVHVIHQERRKLRRSSTVSPHSINFLGAHNMSAQICEQFSDFGFFPRRQTVVVLASVAHLHPMWCAWAVNTFAMVYCKCARTGPALSCQSLSYPHCKRSSAPVWSDK